MLVRTAAPRLPRNCSCCGRILSTRFMGRSSLSLPMTIATTGIKQSPATNAPCLAKSLANYKRPETASHAGGIQHACFTLCGQWNAACVDLPDGLVSKGKLISRSRGATYLTRLLSQQLTHCQERRRHQG